MKAPGSGESARNRWSNLEHIGPGDEIKFVLASRADYEFMRETVRERALARRTPHLLVCPVFGTLAPRDLVRSILADGLPVRLQLQLHKYIWPAGTDGV